MPRYILTGAPGAGKTAVLRLLELNGYLVIEEAATDVIALDNAFGNEESWRDQVFIDKIVTLQQQRQSSVRPERTATVFFDRSPVCTLALSHYLGFTPSRQLAVEVERVVAEGIYEPTVFFVRSQGFIDTTAARRISFEDALVFERLHEQVYRELGFRLVEVPPGPLTDRVALVQQVVDRLQR